MRVVMRECGDVSTVERGCEKRECGGEGCEWWEGVRDMNVVKGYVRVVVKGMVVKGCEGYEVTDTRSCDCKRI